MWAIFPDRVLNQPVVGDTSTRAYARTRLPGYEHTLPGLYVFVHFFLSEIWRFSLTVILNS